MLFPADLESRQSEVVCQLPLPIMLFPADLESRQSDDSRKRLKFHMLFPADLESSQHRHPAAFHAVPFVRDVPHDQRVVVDGATGGEELRVIEVG